MFAQGGVEPATLYIIARKHNIEYSLLRLYLDHDMYCIEDISILLLPKIASGEYNRNNYTAYLMASIDQ